VGEEAWRAVQIKANLRERNIDGTQSITKQDLAPDDATGMIEVLSQQLRNLHRAETHKYCEQVSRVRQKMRRARQTPYRAKVEL
jgi:hypothetical protein